jgi:predicted nuclease of predicted toxin-antitoxin system
VKVKLDENLGRRAIEILEAAGHPVATVHGQQLAGANDVDLLAACIAESRVLVSLDLDFANPFRFDAAATPGIAVLRVPDLPGRSHVLRATTVLCEAMERVDIGGRLWVVDETRVRQYEPDELEPGV